MKAIKTIGYRQPLIRYKYKTIAIEQWCHLDGESEMVTPQERGMLATDSHTCHSNK